MSTHDPFAPASAKGAAPGTTIYDPNRAKPRKPLLVLPPKRPLALTYGLLILLAVIFAMQLAFGVTPMHGLLEPSIATLVSQGALDPDIMPVSHEWYRLFSATLLHAGLLHLAMNGLGLFYAGMVLERMVGRLWFLAVFVASAFAGSCLSFYLNPISMTGVGASGAIMGLFAAAFAASFHLPEGQGRQQVQGLTLRILIPSMLPLAAGGGHVDIAAHLGGAVMGALLGWLLVKSWPATAVYPRLRPLAGLILTLGLLGYGWAIAGVALYYPAYAAAFRQLQAR